MMLLFAKKLPYPRALPTDSLQRWRILIASKMVKEAISMTAATAVASAY